jgi:hypothetical protein
MKRTEFLKGTVSSLALLSLHGCLTKKLYETHDTEYEETALSFLVTEDGSQVVVVGKSYHYIFHDITPSLKEILTGPLRKVVAADLSNFYVRRDNAVTGDYAISLVPEASDEERRSAVNAGFATPELTLSGHLEGTRYSAEGFPAIAKTQEFTRPYVVSIREQESSSRLAGKILLTPITVAADGVLILGGVALFLFVLAMFSPVPRPG